MSATLKTGVQLCMEKRMNVCFFCDRKNYTGRLRFEKFELSLGERPLKVVASYFALSDMLT